MTDQQHVPAVEDVNTRATRNYDPRPKMTQVKGQWYLEVRHRLAWFRAEYPAGKIETTIHHISGQSAVIHATVTALDENGTHFGTGSGVGSCTREEFGAYIEKAETKAIGRALASLGFGTQFSLEYDDAADAGGGNLSALADGPVGQGAPAYGGQQAQNRAPQQPQGGYQQPPRQPYGQQQGGGTGPGGYPLASGKQWGMINGRAKEHGLSEADVDAYIAQTFNANRNTLGKRDASTLIDAIASGQLRPGAGGNGAQADEMAAQQYEAETSLNEVPF